LQKEGLARQPFTREEDYCIDNDHHLYLSKDWTTRHKMMMMLMM